MRQALTLSALVVTLVAMAAIGISAMVEQKRSIRPIEVAVETVVQS